MPKRIAKWLGLHKPGTSLQTILTYPFVFLILVTVILMGFFSFYNSGKAIDRMAGQLMDKTTAQIQDRIMLFLNRAHRVNEINANAIESGQIDLKKVAPLEIHFWNQVRSFEYISYSYLGTAGGGFWGARRLADGTLQIIATQTPTGGKIFYFNTDARGRRTEAVSTLPSYDHKTRPWYKAALQAGKPTWSPVFVDAGGEGLTITAAKPLYEVTGKTKGVLGSSFIFSHINQFLRSLKIGESGQTFIMERSGMLVATSTIDPTSTADKKRIAARESENTLIRHASRLIYERFGDLSGISQNQRFSLDIKGEKYFVHFTPFQDGRGIDWLIAVIVPENDFMSLVKESHRNIILLSLIALILTIIAGFIIARRITKPILKLNLASKALAAGEWSQIIEIDRRDEIGELAESFNLMARQLKDAIGNLEQKVTERTAEIMEISRKHLASEKKYRELYENLRDGSVMFDMKGKIIEFNTEFQNIFGGTTEEILALKFTEITPPDWSAREKEILSEQVLKRGYSGLYEKELTRNNGTILPVEISIYLVRDENNNPSGYCAFVRDITGRKQAEEALKKSRREFSDIIEFLPDATFVIDKEGRIIAWNRAIETMTGIKKESMIGKGDHEYALPFYGERRPILIDYALHPDREMEKQYTDIQRLGDKLLGESLVPNLPPGNIHVAGTASVLRDDKGEIVAAIQCIRDNTEHKKLAERVNRAEKMEALGTLAGGVAHDLNNVLGILVGYSELIREELPADSSLIKYADNLLQSSMKASAIIQDLLTLARRGVNVAEVVDLNRLVRDYLRAPEFEKLKSYYPNVKISTNLEENLLNIKGSPIHLNKTIMNLILNAVESISGHGEVTIKTANRYLDQPVRGYDTMREGDYAVLMVSDTGSGISSNDLGKIFEPFYTKKVMGRSGTGLGLAVVWGTVKDHNGYIDVQSDESKGTIFTLYFPVTREEPAKAEKAVSPIAYMSRGESILVVDDVKEQRELAMNMLSRLSYSVDSVASGEEAIEYLKNKETDLLVLDMIMEPGMDGLETYRRILEIKPGQKAVIVSGFSETERVRDAQAMGAGEFVRKPYILEKIGLAVRKELDRK